MASRYWTSPDGDVSIDLSLISVEAATTDGGRKLWLEGYAKTHFAIARQKQQVEKQGLN